MAEHGARNPPTGWPGCWGSAQWVLLVLQWPLLIIVVTISLAVLYRYAPDRHEAHWSPAWDCLVIGVESTPERSESQDSGHS